MKISTFFINSRQRYYQSFLHDINLTNFTRGGGGNYEIGVEYFYTKNNIFGYFKRNFNQKPFSLSFKRRYVHENRRISFFVLLPNVNYTSAALP